jgi:hypothetical protein
MSEAMREWLDDVVNSISRKIYVGSNTGSEDNE